MLGLRTVVYHVDDLEKAKAWYTAVLGRKPYFDQPYYVGFNVNGYELGLQPDTDGVTWGTNTVAYWGVEDARKSYTDLLVKGGIEHKKVEDVGGGILLGTVIDPCGNVFGIIENPYFKQQEM
jgi:predicted enzyme related to lactoylglutathione lyase